MTRAEAVIEPLAPYDFSQALAYLRRSPSALIEEIGPDWYRRVLTIDGQDTLVTLRPTGSIDEPLLSLEIATHQDAEPLVAAAVAQITRTFSLDSDPTEFQRIASADAVLGRIVELFPGVRPVLIPDPYEALIWAILGQQINVSFARKLKTTLIDLVGRSFQTYPVMPAPDQIAALDPELLRRNQFSRQKIEYVLGVSRAIASGELDLSVLHTLPFEDSIDLLTKHCGIGRWTAEYLLMRAFGARDSIPAADLGLRAIIGRAYGLDRHATEAEVRNLAEAWKPYRGWAAFYWWTALQANVDVSPANL